MRLLGAAALAACAGQGATTIANTFDPCHPPVVVADEPATALETDAIAGALALWGVPATDASSPTLPVRFDDAAAAFRGLYDDQAAVIYINADISDAHTLSIVIAHELGHAFGLVHISPAARVSLMNPGNLVTPPTEADQQAVEALWGRCR